MSSTSRSARSACKGTELRQSKASWPSTEGVTNLISNWNYFGWSLFAWLRSKGSNVPDGLATNAADALLLTIAQGLPDKFLAAMGFHCGEGEAKTPPQTKLRTRYRRTGMVRNIEDIFIPWVPNIQNCFCISTVQNCKTACNIQTFLRGIFLVPVNMKVS